MHEESLIRSLLNQVSELAVDHAALDVTCVEVEIGLLSGVEPLLLESAFERLRPETCCRNAVLQIQQIGLEICCGDCGETSMLQQLLFQCPTCLSNSIRITKGDQVRLMNVTLRKDSVDVCDCEATDAVPQGGRSCL
jgi:hydrogenase nickel incorporation protein HypA/HybF